jgi:uncharacterized membrane protein (UPF0182 family)
MAETLTLALERIFNPQAAADAGRRGAAGEEDDDEAAPAVSATDPSAPAAAPGTEPAAGGTLAELAARARTHMTRADRAMRDGNWALYGQEMERLRKVLEAMRAPQTPR